jgi:hypothetical protein
MQDWSDWPDTNNIYWVDVSLSLTRESILHASLVGLDGSLHNNDSVRVQYGVSDSPTCIPCMPGQISRTLTEYRLSLSATMVMTDVFQKNGIMVSIKLLKV